MQARERNRPGESRFNYLRRSRSQGSTVWLRPRRSRKLLESFLRQIQRGIAKARGDGVLFVGPCRLGRHAALAKERSYPLHVLWDLISKQTQVTRYGDTHRRKYKEQAPKASWRASLPAAYIAARHEGCALPV